MSRSFKKIACSKKNTKGMKRVANSIVRKQLKNKLELSNGSSYKKVFCSYDICDYKTLSSNKFRDYYFKLEKELLEQILEYELKIKNYDLTKIELEKITLQEVIEKKYEESIYSKTTIKSLARHIKTIIKEEKNLRFFEVLVDDKDFFKEHKPSKKHLVLAIGIYNGLTEACFDSLKRSKENLEEELRMLPKIAKRDWLSLYKGK